jgi:hypothetical protein
MLQLKHPRCLDLMVSMKTREEFNRIKAYVNIDRRNLSHTVHPDMRAGQRCKTRYIIKHDKDFSGSRWYLLSLSMNFLFSCNTEVRHRVQKLATGIRTKSAGFSSYLQAPFLCDPFSSCIGLDLPSGPSVLLMLCYKNSRCIPISPYVRCISSLI